MPAEELESPEGHESLEEGESPEGHESLEEGESPEGHESLEENEPREGHESLEGSDSLEDPEFVEENEPLERREPLDEPGSALPPESDEERALAKRGDALGRLLDPDALACSAGPRGKLCVEVPAAWLDGPVELSVIAPARIVCARCDGGGCDGCGRSGALRGPAEEAARTLSVRLPDGAGGGALLRLVRPFGDTAPIEQILIEVRSARRASPGVARIAPPAALARPGPSYPRGALGPIVILAAVAVVIALVIASRP